MKKKQTKDCDHTQVNVWPEYARAYGYGGFKDHDELKHFNVECLKCRKRVAIYSVYEAAEVIKDHFLKQEKE